MLNDEHENFLRRIPINSRLVVHRGRFVVSNRPGRCNLSNRPGSDRPASSLHNHFRLLRSSQQRLRSYWPRAFGGAGRRRLFCRLQSIDSRRLWLSLRRAVADSAGQPNVSDDLVAALFASLRHSSLLPVLPAFSGSDDGPDRGGFDCHPARSRPSFTKIKHLEACSFSASYAITRLLFVLLCCLGVAVDTRAEAITGFTQIDYYADTDTLDAYSETDVDLSLAGDYDAYVSLRILDGGGFIIASGIRQRLLLRRNRLSGKDRRRNKPRHHLYCTGHAQGLREFPGLL